MWLGRPAIVAAVTPHDLSDTVATEIVRELVARRGLADGLREAAALLRHSGMGKALLSYAEPSATVEDHSSILAGLDPATRRARELHSQARKALTAAGLVGWQSVEHAEGVTVGPAECERAAMILGPLGARVVVNPTFDEPL